MLLVAVFQFNNFGHNQKIKTKSIKLGVKIVKKNQQKSRPKKSFFFFILTNFLKNIFVVYCFLFLTTTEKTNKHVNKTNNYIKKPKKNKN